MANDRPIRVQAVPPAIEVSGLGKDFGDNRALDGLDLAVPASSVCGVLGPNGAGKTTLIRILATLAQPDRGTARVLGHDVVRDAAAVRSRISLTGQFAAVDNDLTAVENLYLLARLRGFSRRGARSRARELLETFGLPEAADRQVKALSGGMRRRLDLAASIVVIPELLFLDEPTTGLDPHSRSQVWDVIRGAVAAGTTVLLTTQYLEEADRLADRIAVIDRGRLVAAGTPGELKAATGSGTLELRVLEPRERPHAADVVARALDAVVRLDGDPSALSAPVSRPGDAARVLLELERLGIDVSAVAVGQPRLDEVFLALTGHPAADDTPQPEAA